MSAISEEIHIASVDFSLLICRIYSSLYKESLIFLIVIK